MPGDPSDDSILSATPAFGGIDVQWTLPGSNPQAVAYARLYRGLSANFDSAILLTEVSDTRYHDRIDTPTLYYYWIRLVSVNGTVGELIGPASAVAKPTIAGMLELLTGQIDSSALALALKAEIARIQTINLALVGEITSRQNGETTLAEAMADVDAGVAQTLTFLANEQASEW